MATTIHRRRPRHRLLIALLAAIAVGAMGCGVQNSIFNTGTSIPQGQNTFQHGVPESQFIGQEEVNDSAIIEAASEEEVEMTGQGLSPAESFSERVDPADDDGGKSPDKDRVAHESPQPLPGADISDDMIYLLSLTFEQYDAIVDQYDARMDSVDEEERAILEAELNVKIDDLASLVGLSRAELREIREIYRQNPELQRRMDEAVQSP